VRSSSFLRIILVVVFLVLCCKAVWAQSWPLPRHDTRNSASSSVKGSPVADLKWARHLAGPIYDEPVVDSQGNIYVIAGGYLYAFDAGGGEIFVPVSLVEEVYAEKAFSPSLSGDGTTIYIGLETASGAAVAAYDAERGVKKWVYKGNLGGRAVSSLTVEGNVIYFGTDEDAGFPGGGLFYAVKDNGYDAEEIWHYAPLPNDDISYPYPAVIEGNDLYFTVVKKGAFEIFRVDKQTGEDFWKYPIERQVSLRGPVVLNKEGDRLYVPCETYLYIYRASDRSNLGYYKLSAGGEAGKVTPAAVDDAGRVIVLAYDRLHCLDPEGKLLWKSSPEELAVTISPNAGPVVDGDGNIYFGDSIGYGDAKGTLYAVDSNGALKWHYDTDALITCSPVIGPSGSVIFGNYNGDLYVLNDITPPEVNVVTPRNGIYVHGSVTFTVEAADRGESGIEGVYVSTDGGQEWLETVGLGGGEYCWEWQVPGSVTNSVYSITFRAVDYSGNEKYSDLEFIIDNTAPESSINFTGEVEDHNVQCIPGDVITITGTARDTGSGVRRIVFVAESLSDGSKTVIGWVYNEFQENPFSWEINWSEEASGSYKVLCYFEDSSFSTERPWDVPGGFVVGNFTVEEIEYGGEPVIFNWKTEEGSEGGTRPVDEGKQGSDQQEGEQQEEEQQNDEQQEQPGDVEQGEDEDPGENTDQRQDGSSGSPGRGNSREEVIREADLEKVNIPDSAQNVFFKDLNGDRAAEIIGVLVAAGVVDGYPDGTFRPGREITRAEFIKMLVSLLDLELVQDNLNFTDADRVPEWGKPYIMTAVRLGIIKGFGDGTLRPNKKLNFAELKIILMRVLEYLNGSRDADARVILKTVLRKIQQDKNGPKSKITRGHAVNVLYYLAEVNF